MDVPGASECMPGLPDRHYKAMITQDTVHVDYPIAVVRDDIIGARIKRSRKTKEP